MTRVDPPHRLLKLFLIGNIAAGTAENFAGIRHPLKLQPKGFFSNSENENDNDKSKTLCAINVLNSMIDREMDTVFPNICIAFRIFVIIPIANCEVERSFSVLKRIKNVPRATMLDSRFSALASLTIEVELLRSIDFDVLIEKFANEKSRKKCYNF